MVNAVNTVGVMGKGIALMFKKAFPDNFRQYKRACDKNEVLVGKMFTSRSDSTNQWIINFPTKKHWRNESELGWIESGLDDLKRFVIEKHIKSIAIPPLGCGYGKLKWDDVRALMEKKLSVLK